MLTNPVPGSTRQANDGGYSADSGLDISVPAGTPCVCAADGVVEYAEQGHTPWYEDTRLDVPGFQPPWSVRIRLATPIVHGGVTYPWIWYTHLSAVDSSIRGRSGVGIRAGAPVGRTGIGNKVAHLHFGVLHDQAQTVTMPMEQVRDLVWPTAPAAPARPALRVTLASSGQGDPGRVIPCSPAIQDGVTRVDLRPLCDALGAELELHLEDGFIVVHHRT